MRVSDATVVACDDKCVTREEHHHIEFVDGTNMIHYGQVTSCGNDICKMLVHLDEREEVLANDIASNMADIAEWWVRTAKSDAEKTVPKAVEYGSLDFDLMGVFMVGLLGDRLEGADAEEKARVGKEMAVLFYLIGKMGRAIGAYAQGVLPSDDTLFDTVVYGMMWRKIRETGRWV